MNGREIEQDAPVLAPEEARQGQKGWPILGVAIVSTLLAAAGMTIFFIASAAMT